MNFNDMIQFKYCFSIYRRKTRNVGFTLIELSIVLVIIGLIVGGVLVGRDLIASSEIRAQIKQIEEFQTAANTFRIKYGHLPGDIPPAQTTQLGFFTFTGTNAGRSVILFATNIYAYGNDNGVIEAGEWIVFWRHLSDANMVGGQFGYPESTGGYLNADTTVPVTGGNMVNVSNTANFLPTTKITNDASGFCFMCVTVRGNRARTTGVTYNNSSKNNYFEFRTSPYQSYSIDNKIDDGIPDTGTTRDYRTQYSGGAFSPCTIAGTPMTYNLSSTTANNPSTCMLDMLW